MIHIFIIIIILFYFIQYYNKDTFTSINTEKNIKNIENTENIENTNYDIESNIENEIDNSIVNDIISGEEYNLNCHLYGCNNSKTQRHSMYFIGHDADKNAILNLKDNYYTLDNNNIVNTKQNIQNIKKNEEIVMIPINNNKINIKLYLDDYILAGYLKNNFYNIKYLVYYKKIINSLYNYIIVELLNNIYTIKYNMLPREKINIEETIYIEESRILRIGPFIFTNKF
jgi:hypothetical protein